MFKILHGQTQFRFVNWFPLAWASCAHTFSLAKMGSEEQKPPAKMDFLLVCG